MPFVLVVDPVLPVQTPQQLIDWLKRRPDGFVPGLGAIPDLLATAFAMEPGQSSPRIFETDDVVALVQTLEHKPADAQVIEQRLPSVREQLLESKRNARADRWVNARREELVASGELFVDLPESR